MDTSESTRTIVLLAGFVFLCVVAMANLRLAAQLIARRKVGRFSRIAWPALLALCVVCVIDAFYWEPNWVQLRHHSIETHKLPPNTRVRIVQITDFHLMGELTARELKAVRLTRRAAPDLIVLTGDYTVPKSPAAIAALTRMAKMLSRIAPTYAVEGNWDGPEDFAALEKGGVEHLRKWRRIECGETVIALGRAEWYGGGMERIPQSCRGLYTVVLCHVPGHFETLGRMGVDLVLAGHTHGGQVRIPVFGALIPNRTLVGKYQAGFYEDGGSLMYVNRGLGCERCGAPEVRFFCRPEVAVFEIVGTGGKGQ